MPTYPILTDDGYERLLEATRANIRLYTYTLLLGDGGLRPGEPLGLRWQDIDLAERIGWIRIGKFGTRRFPVSRRLATALAEYQNAAGRSSPGIFSGAWPVGHEHGLARLRRAIQNAAEKAGLRWILRLATPVRSRRGATNIRG